MKMIYGSVPVKNLHITKHDVSTQDATVVASDLQAGVTCYARGQKVTGTGKCFEFARYGSVHLNMPIPIGASINIIEVASVNYPVLMTISLDEMKNIDFSSTQEIAKVIVDGIDYIVTATVENNMLTISCDRNISLEIFYGKDNFV